MARLPVKGSSFSPALLNEDLADREGLTGTARENFLAFLSAIERPVRPGGWRLFFSVVILTALLGVLIAASFREHSSLLLPLWLAYALVGIGLTLGLRRAERSPVRHDPELNWRVYCLVIRPILLGESPGLLDRNHPNDLSAREQIEVRPSEVCSNIFRDRGADFWWSSIIGLWLGLSGLLLGHFWLRLSIIWIWPLPAAGLVMGPLAWSLIQWLAWHLARTRPWLRRW
jgi:hypothetical protein